MIFRIDLDELLMNGRIITTLENGKKVTSEPSAVKLNGKYIFACDSFFLSNSIFLISKNFLNIFTSAFFYL